jgi:hypothetical protein
MGERERKPEGGVTRAATKAVARRVPMGAGMREASWAVASAGVASVPWQQRASGGRGNSGTSGEKSRAGEAGQDVQQRSRRVGALVFVKCEGAGV